jgi:hypothetical protein
MRRAFVAAGVLALLAGALVWWLPYLTRDRDYAATVAQPLPISGPAFVELRGGQRACFGPVTMTSDSAQARFAVGTFFRPAGPPMELTVSGPGYSARRSIPAGFADNAPQRIDLPRPPRDISVQVCISNGGRRKVALQAASDRTKAPFVTRVDGRRQPANPAFAFYEGRPVSMLDKLPRVFERISLFRPGFIGPWLLWPLTVVVLLGVPLLALWALRRAVDEDEREDEDGAPRDPAAADEAPEGPLSAPAA